MVRRLRVAIPLAAIVAAIVGVVLFVVQPWSDGEELLVEELLVQEAMAEDIPLRVCNLVIQWPADVPKLPLQSRYGEGVRPWAVRRQDQMGLRLLSFDFAVVYKMPVGTAGTGPKGVRSFAIVDSVTGELVQTRYANAQDQALIERVLEGVRLEPLDPATAPWPYTDDRQEPLQPEKKGRFTYLSPDPGSGLKVKKVNEDVLLLYNCRSEMWIELVSGPAGPDVEVDETSTRVHPDDKAAFQTFFDELEKRTLEQ